MATLASASALFLPSRGFLAHAQDPFGVCGSILDDSEGTLEIQHFGTLGKTIGKVVLFTLVHRWNVKASHVLSPILLQLVDLGGCSG